MHPGFKDPLLKDRYISVKPGPLHGLEILSGSAIPPYDFLNLYGDLACRFKTRNG
jgi:hypothetical protein